MALYTQAGRPMSLTTPLGPDALLLEELHGSEAVSELFRFRLDLLGDAARPVAFEKVLGQVVTVTLALPGGGHRYLSGIVRRFAEGPQLPGAQGRPTFTRYRMDVVPRLWLLTKRVRSRIFQQQSVPEVLRDVLAGLDVDFRLQGTYKPRDYCVQYRESDFAFASRLMEDEGIAYFFSHAADGHTLVLTDNPQGHPFVPGPSQVHFEGHPFVPGHPLVPGPSRSQAPCQLHSLRAPVFSTCARKPTPPARWTDTPTHVPGRGPVRNDRSLIDMKMNHRSPPRSVGDGSV